MKQKQNKSKLRIKHYLKKNKEQRFNKKNKNYERSLNPDLFLLNEESGNYVEKKSSSFSFKRKEKKNKWIDQLRLGKVKYVPYAKGIIPLHIKVLLVELKKKRYD